MSSQQSGAAERLRDSEKLRMVLALAPTNPASIPAIRARAFVFSDPRSRELLPLIERIAPSEANVLVTGDTGTGKEIVARYIHGLSDRAQAAFIPVNCGAFSENLVEAELFGHERGAFTGAVESRPGWFEVAQGGTLFLDEVGDLPLSLQVKLLRVLQEREVVRVGSKKAIPVDVRLIAATNIDLARAVVEGRFREDLYYRLKVVTIPILPLRERPDDILPLARHFLETYGKKSRHKNLSLTPGAEAALFRHPWNGNIRELENAIHRATLVSADGVIETSDLGLTQGPRHRPLSLAPVADEPSHTDGSILLPELEAIVRALVNEGAEDILDRTIETVIRTTYDICAANQVRTAAALGITRNVLRTHLKNLNIL